MTLRQPSDPLGDRDEATMAAHFEKLAEIDERKLEAAKMHPGIRRFAAFSLAYLRRLRREGRA